MDRKFHSFKRGDFIGDRRYDFSRLGAMAFVPINYVDVLSNVRAWILSTFDIYI